MFDGLRRATVPAATSLQNQCQGRLLEARQAPIQSVQLIIGSARSGTTWLQESLARTTGYSVVFEPFRWGSDPLLPRRGVLDGFWEAGSNLDDPEMEIYVRAVFEGRRLSRWSGSRTTLRAHLRARGLVVKAIRANRSAGWIATNFPDTKRFAVVRDPLTTVGSMLNSPGAWHSWEPEQIARMTFGGSRAAREALKSASPSRAALLTAWWWVETRALLTETQTSDVFHAAFRYEDLVRRTEDAIGRLALATGLPESQLAAKLSEPSSTANGKSQATLSRLQSPNLARDDLGEVLRALNTLQADYPASLF